jgi:hypothetical protein
MTGDVGIEDIVRRLDAENEVRKLVLKMSLGMDMRDFDILRAAWADEVEFDIPAFGLNGPLRADDYVRGSIDSLSEFKATQHVSTNHDVTVDGDSATCISYVLATHQLPMDDGDQWCTVGARYDIVARRLSIGWRTVRFKWTRLWTSGNYMVFDEANRRLAARRAA